MGKKKPEPGKTIELEEMNIFTAEKLDELMKEAETIMEGWKKTA